MSKKVVIVGDSQTGKTAFIKAITNENFSEKYDPTQGAEVTTFKMNDIQLTFWDCSGSNKGLADGYYIGADVAVVFLDHNYPSKDYALEIKRVAGNIPIIYVRSKFDIIVNKMDALRDKITYISAKTGFNCRMLLEKIAAK
jgi:small GTP-binding protein